METKDVVLTQEMKDRLKGFVAFTVDTDFSYVPKVYRENNFPKETWPLYRLKSKDGIELAQAEDEAGYVELAKKGDAQSKLKMQSGKARLDTLRDGIISCKKQPLEGDRFVSYDKPSKTLTIIDAEGKEHIKNTDVSGLIRLLPIALQMELQDAINERSTLTEEELSGLI
ncbi:MAG: hypothetical protein KKD77_24590 [Gammaproteobacteria bacterium]|nr:hypothetical protein [Gammaproteobacteria bacterium]